MKGTWSEAADCVLAELFKIGQPAPTKEQLRDAYPFGERAYWPYKVWLRRCREWRKAHARALPAPISAEAPKRDRIRLTDNETLDAFTQAGAR